VIGKLEKMSTVDNEVNNTSVCANCGKEGDSVNNVCNQCKQVKYCNAVCKKVHKKKHKKDCEEHVRRVAEKHNEELRIAAKLHDIELFKEPPSQFGDCPICFLRLPFRNTGRAYFSCCGKMICSGCSWAPVYDNQGNEVDNKKCAFCRTPDPESYEEIMKRHEKRVDADDPIAIYTKGNYYKDGRNGYPQDYAKALELFHRSAELGCSEAYTSIGYVYLYGEGVEVDKKKARHYWELAAIGGDASARHNLGINEGETGNVERALKHWMIAVRGGESESLKQIKVLYSNGHATKGDYTTALQLYQEYLGEIKSPQRDEAAAADERNRYY